MKNIKAWLARLEKRAHTTPGINSIHALLAVLPALIAIVIFGLLPALLNIGLSFTDYQGPGYEWEFVWFKNYIDFFTLEGGKVFVTLGRTLRFSFFTVLIQQTVSIATAVMVNRIKLSSNFFRAIYFLPSILGITVVSYMWVMMFDPISGPISYFLANFDINSGFLGDPDIALALVIMVAIWANFGFSMTIYIAGLQSIPNELYEAANIDGASAFQRFKNITLPLLRPSMTINFWISISGTLGMFDIILLLTGGGPGGATTTFSLYFFQRVTQTAINQGQTAAMSIYFFIFVTTIMLTFNFLFRRKEVEL